MSRSRDVSAVQNNLGVAIPPAAAGKNAIINGAFDIWQRGTTFTNPGSAGIYTVDRWCVYFNNNGTLTQETSVKPDTSTYSLKNTATTTVSSNDIYQLIEQLNMEHLRGKEVVFSVKLAGTATVVPTLTVTYSTTANDNLLNTGTAISGTVLANPTLNPTTFQTWAIRLTIPTTAKTLRVGIVSNAMANTNVLYIAEAQLELGNTATPFSRAGGNIQGELAACQRYFFRAVNGADDASESVGIGQWYNGTISQTVFRFPVIMRTAPTMAVSSAGYFTQSQGGATAKTVTSTAYYNTTPRGTHLDFTSSSATATAGTSAHLYASNVNATLDFSSEL